MVLLAAILLQNHGQRIMFTMVRRSQLFHDAMAESLAPDHQGRRIPGYFGNAMTLVRASASPEVEPNHRLRPADDGRWPGETSCWRRARATLLPESLREPSCSPSSKCCDRSDRAILQGGQRSRRCVDTSTPTTRCSRQQADSDRPERPWNAGRGTAPAHRGGPWNLPARRRPRHRQAGFGITARSPGGRHPSWPMEATSWVSWPRAALLEETAELLALAVRNGSGRLGPRSRRLSRATPEVPGR